MKVCFGVCLRWGKNPCSEQKAADAVNILHQSRKNDSRPNLPRRAPSLLISIRRVFSSTRAQWWLPNQLSIHLPIHLRECSCYIWWTVQSSTTHIDKMLKKERNPRKWKPVRCLFPIFKDSRPMFSSIWLLLLVTIFSPKNSLSSTKKVVLAHIFSICSYQTCYLSSDCRYQHCRQK